MCGIFGVHGHPDAAHLAQLGLYSLQHRGQESVGIVVDRRRRARARGAAAWDSSRTDVAAHELRASCPAIVAIGHTRYSTAGSSTIENAQPVARALRAAATSRSRTTATSPTPPSCASSSRSRDRSSRRRWTPKSSSIASRARRRRRPTSALADALQRRRRRVQPRRRDRRHAARRARSARLAAARAWASSATRSSSRPRPARSTSSARRSMRDVEPGEIVVVDGTACARCIRCRTQDLERCVFEYVYFARPDSRVFGGSVDRARRALGRRLAREYPAPRPISCSACPTRRTPRRSASPRRADLPLELALIRNHYVGRTFIQPTQAGRDAKVKVKYNAVREVLDGKSVVMVDDSIVRGTTTRGLVAMVRAAGAREVHMRVSSPPVTGPCYYGIDTPTREELIAANMTVDEIAAAPRRRFARLPLARRHAGVGAGRTARLLPCLLLGRLPDAAADRPGQAPLRLRLLSVTAAVSRTVEVRVYFFGNGARRRHAGHEGRPRRQGRQPRRDDESRRSGSAGLHDRVRDVHRRTSRDGKYSDALRAEVEGDARAARSSRPARSSAIRRIRCSSPCAPARRCRCPA